MGPGRGAYAEQCRKLDIRWHFGKRATQRRHWKYQYRWRDEWVRFEGDSAELTFDTRSGQVVQVVALTGSPCHFHGERTWFECPKCSRRAGVLFLRGGLFLCRRCQKIRYRSQSFSRTVLGRALINFQVGIKR